MLNQQEEDEQSIQENEEIQNRLDQEGDDDNVNLDDLQDIPRQ